MNALLVGAWGFSSSDLLPQKFTPSGAAERPHRLPEMLQGQCFKVRIVRKAELRVCAYDVKTAVKFDGPPLSGFFKTSNRQLAGLHVGKGSSLTSAQLGIDLDEA